MLQMYTNRIKNTYRLFDLQGTIMPTAMHAEGLICVRLHKTGSSGYQVDVWDREPLCEPRDNQIDCSD